MKVITLLNEKGGVGKTTLATHIAAGLAIRGWRVVLVDADAQGQASALMGLPKEAGFYNLLVRDAEWKEVIRYVSPEVYSATPVKGELHILPGNSETTLISIARPNPFIIRQRITELDGFVDVVVFDTSPAPSMIHTAIYMATDSVLLPTIPGYLGIDGIAHSIIHQDNAKSIRESEGMGEMNRLGIIPTMVRNTVAHDAGLQQLIKTFKRNLWPAMPQRTIFEEAAFKGQLLYRYAPQDETTTDILGALVDRVELGIGLKHAQVS